MQQKTVEERPSSRRVVSNQARKFIAVNATLENENFKTVSVPSEFVPDEGVRTRRDLGNLSLGPNQL